MQINQPQVDPYRGIQQTINGYCFWDVRNFSDFVIVCSNLGIFTFIVVTLYVRRKQVQHDNNKERRSRNNGNGNQSNINEQATMKNIQSYLKVWYVSYMVQWVFSIIINGWHKFNGIDGIDQCSVSIYSAVYQTLDFIPAFILMGCLLYISKILLQKIDYDCQNNLQNIKLSKYQKCYLSFLKKYVYWRSVIIIPVVVLLILASYSPERSQSLLLWSNIQLISFLIDVIICNLSLWISMRTLRMTHQNLQYNDSKLKCRILKQTILLQLAGFTRLIMGFIFAFLEGLSTNQQITCPKTSLARSILYIVVAQYLMHLIPVCVILKIFNYQKQQAASIKYNSPQSKLID